MNTDNSLIDFRIKFRGRVRRKTYWLSQLALSLPIAVAVIVMGIAEKTSGAGMYVMALIMSGFLCIYFCLVGLSLNIRRFHDIGRSGWWQLWLSLLVFLLELPVLLVPHMPSLFPTIVNILVQIHFFSRDSEKGTNKWGPSPKYGKGSDQALPEGQNNTAEGENLNAGAADTPSETPAEPINVIIDGIIFSPLSATESSAHEDKEPSNDNEIVSENHDHGDSDTSLKADAVSVTHDQADKSPSQSQIASNSLWWVFAFVCFVLTIGAALYHLKQESSFLEWRTEMLEEIIGVQKQEMKEAMKSLQNETGEMKEAMKSLQNEIGEMKETMQSLQNKIEELEKIEEQKKRDEYLRKTVNQDSLKECKKAIECDANVSAISNTSKTAESKDQMLYVAACNNAIQSCKTAIDAGANVNASLYMIKWTPLHIAAKNGHSACVDFLLYHGAQVNVQDIDGQTPLMIAAQENHPDVCESLIRAGADVSIARPGDGRTALHDAAKYPDGTAYNILIMAGADVNAKDKRGNTPEDIKRGDMYKQTQAAGGLIPISPPASYESSEETKNQYAGYDNRASLDPLIANMRNLQCHEAESRLYQKRLLTLLPLIRNGADVDVTLLETKGNTALHYAVAIGSWSITQWLVEHGANVNARTHAGKTPLQCVGGENAAQVRAYLIANGAR